MRLRTLVSLHWTAWLALIPTEAFPCAQSFEGGEGEKATLSASREEGSRDELKDTFYSSVNEEVSQARERLEELLKELTPIENILKEDDKQRQGWFSYFRRKLTPEDRQRLEAKHKSLKQERRTLESKLDNVNRKHYLKVIGAGLSKPELKPLYIEQFKWRRVRRLRRSTTVTLAMGGVANGDHSQIGKVVGFAQALNSRGYLVLYDADTPAGEALKGQVNGLGVTLDRQKQSKNVIYFANPYLKFAALIHPNRVVADIHSPSGVALQVFDRVTHLVDLHQQPSGGLASWADHIKSKGLGIGLKYRKLRPFKSMEALLSNKAFATVKESDKIKVVPQKVPGRTDYKKAKVSTMQSMVEYVWSVGINGRATDGLNGVVVYGSSGLHRRFVEGTYQLGRQLGEWGVPVTTGGAGGMMLAANMGAYDAGAFSIGIPIFGRNQLKSETKIPTEVQTHTIYSADYPSRIYLLGKDKEGTIFVPGRSGTMRELATTLVAWTPDSGGAILLFNSDYYRGLYDWLQLQPLPEPLREQIYLIDHPEQALEILAAGELTVSEVSPRSSQSQFPLSHSDLTEP